MQPQYAAACRRALVLARLSGMTTSLTRCLHATMPDLYAALKPGPESLDGLHVRNAFPRIHSFAKLGETPGS